VEVDGGKGKYGFVAADVLSDTEAETGEGVVLDVALKENKLGAAAAECDCEGIEKEDGAAEDEKDVGIEKGEEEVDED